MGTSRTSALMSRRSCSRTRGPCSVPGRHCGSLTGRRFRRRPSRPRCPLMPVCSPSPGHPHAQHPRGPWQARRITTSTPQLSPANNVWPCACWAASGGSPSWVGLEGSPEPSRARGSWNPTLHRSPAGRRLGGPWRRVTEVTFLAGHRGLSFPCTDCPGGQAGRRGSAHGRPGGQGAGLASPRGPQSGPPAAGARPDAPSQRSRAAVGSRRLARAGVSRWGPSGRAPRASAGQWPPPTSLSEPSCFPHLLPPSGLGSAPCQSPPARPPPRVYRWRCGAAHGGASAFLADDEVRHFPVSPGPSGFSGVTTRFHGAPGGARRVLLTVCSNQLQTG